MGFLAKIVHWIMVCISTVSYSLLLNGGLTAPFPTNRGIKQRDPMSPYLFILAMEYLVRELNQLAANGDFNYHPRCERLNSNHICFADDLLMYCRDDLSSVKLMHASFMRFSEAFGLKANNEKSFIYIAG